MVMIPLVDLKAQYKTIRACVDEAIQRVIDTTAFINGPDVAAFEQEFSAWCGAAYGVGISSGTDAIHLTLRACGVKQGDEVITTPFTFIATAEAISMCGARPVFVDIDPRTYNIDPSLVEQAVTPRTRALLPVHLFGQPADIDPLLAIAAKHSLHVIEDAAQAHGAGYRGRRVGTLANAACFSFYPGKNLGAYGDAGAVVTNDATLAERVRMLRDHGRRDKYEHLIEGYGARLDTMQAAILRAKLPHLDQWTARRRAIAALYDELLEGSAVSTPFCPEWAEPVHHLYVVRTPDRATLQASLKSAGIGSGVHYPIPLHRQPAYAWLNDGKGAFPNAESAADEVLSLPIFPEMTDDDVHRVASVVRG